MPNSTPKPPDWDALCGAWQGERPGTGRKVLSLYSGAGGLDRGFLDAGFEITHAIESDADAVATYKANLGDHIVCDKLPAALKALPKPKSRPFDVVIGGPPCQGFSVMGLMDPEDPRSRHVHVFLDAVRVYRPAAFCMENVKALAAGKRWESIFKGLVARAEALGYNVAPVVLNAAHYTVPQARQRLFIIGVRDGFPVLPVPVTSTRPMTVLEAFTRLPVFGRPGNDSKCTARVVLAKKPVMRASPYMGSLLFNGSGRPLDLDAVARTLPASMGGNATPIVDRKELAARLDDPKSEVTSWIVRHHARLMAGNADLKGPHPLRRITVEEAAELQGFPQRWEWVGAKNAQYRMIGNAVPPRLARYVAISVGHALQARETWLPTEPAALAPRRISATPRSIAPRRHAVAA